MQSDAPPAQGSSRRVEEEASPLATSKRRRRSKHSIKPSPLLLNSVSGPSGLAPPSTLTPSGRSPLKRGSSRESEMHRSSTPPEGSSSGAVKYTRTGRVSKAAKGQRVHDCDECGKTYTRAEHLRRHQQNHKPGTFLCDVPGCGRSLYREDLLLRHKARHNDPLSPSSRRASVGSQRSDQGGEPDGQSTVANSTSLQRASAAEHEHTPLDQPTKAPRATAQPTESSRTPRKGYLNINELPITGQAISIHTSGPYTAYPVNQAWDLSPSYSPVGYESPAHAFPNVSAPPYFNQPQATRFQSGSSVLSFDGGYLLQPHASLSPVSVGSPTTYVPHWSTEAQSAAFNHSSSSSSSSDGTYLNGTSGYSTSEAQHFVQTFSNGVTRLISAEERDIIEQEELNIPEASPQSPFNINFDDANPPTNEQRYLEAYWTWTHPLFPVVHKPSFDLYDTSPLLRAAMLALGAHSLRTQVDMHNACIVHERCARIVKKRNVNRWHTYRVCDMQAILLHEIYSVFRSRRTPLHFSKCFEDVYRRLADDPEALALEAASSLHDSQKQTGATYYNDHAEGMMGGKMVGQDVICKQRLLLACYVLDQQHAALFGRRQTSCLGLSGMNLPFPQSQQGWEAMPDQQAEIDHGWRSPSVEYYSPLYKVMSALSMMSKASDDPHDAFQSFLVMACLTDPSHDLQAIDGAADDDIDQPPILRVVEQTPRTRLAFHTLMLCKHTPIQDLLAVVGESWCMAQKLASSIEYRSAQREALLWAKGATNTNTGVDYSPESDQPPVHRALHHARQIIEILQQQPSRTGLHFEEWSIYLATLVIWARAYVTSSEPPRQKSRRSTIPTLTEPRPPLHELEQTVTAFLHAAPSSVPLSSSEVRNILLWTKAKIEKVDVPHSCGLTNDAVDVLSKLASRGADRGWFEAV